MAKTTCKITWVFGLLGDLKVQVRGPVHLYCDNKVANDIATNPVFHERMKHIEINCHFVREKNQEGIIKTMHIGTAEQPADIFTFISTMQA